MNKTIKKNIAKESIGTSKRYPVIYSYIYEREAEDIKRLAEDFKRAVPKIPSTPIEEKEIFGFEIKDGKVVPIFKNKLVTDHSVSVSVKEATKSRLVNLQSKFVAEKSATTIKKEGPKKKTKK